MRRSLPGFWNRDAVRGGLDILRNANSGCTRDLAIHKIRLQSSSGPNGKSIPAYVLWLEGKKCLPSSFKKNHLVFVNRLLILQNITKFQCLRWIYDPGLRWRFTRGNRQPAHAWHSADKCLTKQHRSVCRADPSCQGLGSSLKADGAISHTL